jgi:hypothetical protein
MTNGMRWMGARCPSCGCNGIPPITYASCCRCNPPSQIVVTSLLYPVTQYTTTGPYVWQSAELIASNMTLSTSGLPTGCYQYKDFVVGDGWDTGQPIGAYDYLNENAWYSYVNGTQYNDNQVTPWELNVYFTCNNNSTTMRVEFGDAGAQEVFTSTLSASTSIPTQESLCETDSIVSGTTSNLQYYKKLTFTTVKDFNICDWHGNYTGCDMSNMTLTNGVKTLSGNNDGNQNGSSSWTSGGMSGDYIVVPNDAGSDWRFGKPSVLANGSNRIALYNQFGVVVANYEMNACEGNTTWTNIGNSADVFTFTISGGRHCNDI